LEIEALSIWVKMPFRGHISYIGQVGKEIKKQHLERSRFTTQFTNAEIDF